MLVAQAILAPLAGRPFMLGFIPYTWAALVAHIIYTLASRSATKIFPSLPDEPQVAGLRP